MLCDQYHPKLSIIRGFHSRSKIVSVLIHCDITLSDKSLSITARSRKEAMYLARYCEVIAAKVFKSGFYSREMPSAIRIRTARHLVLEGSLDVLRTVAVRRELERLL